MQSEKVLLETAITTIAELSAVIDATIGTLNLAKDNDPVYIILPDGSVVNGLQVVEETLTDGSTVRNIRLLTRKPQAVLQPKKYAAVAIRLMLDDAVKQDKYLFVRQNPGVRWLRVIGANRVGSRVWIRTTHGDIIHSAFDTFDIR